MGDFMKLEMSGQMRLEQKMKLAPHMIQSMEILQLPILALQERIEQELNSNPVLEIDEPSGAEEIDPTQQQAQIRGEQRGLSSETDGGKAEDFRRLDNLGEDYKEHLDQSGPFHRRVRSEDVDLKLEAIKNTAAPPQ